MHSELTAVYLSFNRLMMIASNTFSGLDSLEILLLDDNSITRIEKKAFNDLERLKYLNLRGNNIDFISQEVCPISCVYSDSPIATLKMYFFRRLLHLCRHISRKRGGSISFDRYYVVECFARFDYGLPGSRRVLLVFHPVAVHAVFFFQAFENLPELEHLDLAYNKLSSFSFSWLDQVGILSSLCLNVSHNQIDQLVLNRSLAFDDISQETMHVNVKVGAPRDSPDLCKLATGKADA